MEDNCKECKEVQYLVQHLLRACHPINISWMNESGNYEQAEDCRHSWWWDLRLLSVFSAIWKVNKADQEFSLSFSFSVLLKIIISTTLLQNDVFINWCCQKWSKLFRLKLDKYKQFLPSHHTSCKGHQFTFQADTVKMWVQYENEMTVTSW